jgi:hypothetical protein
MGAPTANGNEGSSAGDAIEFDGTSTITLDDTYRLQVAASFRGSTLEPTALEQLRQRYLDAVQRSARCTHNVEVHATPSEVELGAQSEAREELICARRAYLQELTTLRSRGFLPI